jgi:hypothetical protein
MAPSRESAATRLPDASVARADGESDRRGVLDVTGAAITAAELGTATGAGDPLATTDTGAGVLLSVVVDDVTAESDGATGPRGVVDPEVAAGVAAAAGADGRVTGGLVTPATAPLPVGTGVEADPVPPSPGSVPGVEPVEPVVTGDATDWLLLPASSCSEEGGCVLETGATLSWPSSLADPLGAPDGLFESSSVSFS